MGQPALELPDPLQTPPVDAAGADDLLAQLAGDEIDRLLAEADIEPIPADNESWSLAPAPPAPLASSAASSPPASSPPSAHSPQHAAEVDLLADASLSPGDAAAGNAPLPDEFDASLPPRNTPPLVPITAAAPVARPVALSAPAPVNAAAPSSAADDIARELDELDAAGDPATAAVPPLSHDTPPAAVSLPDVLDQVLAGSDTPTLPLYLRPLQWLNAPFAGLSERTRVALGKVAIITLLNALALLAYVLYFRQ